MFLLTEKHESELFLKSKLKGTIMTKKRIAAVKASIVEEVKAKKVGIGSSIITLILDNPELSNTEILEKIKAQFEAAQTSYACIAWYKSKLRKEGKIGAREFKKKAKPQTAAE